MTKKKRRRSSTYRPQQQAVPAEDVAVSSPRRGLLDQLFAPRTGHLASMPGMGGALGRGLITVVASPWIVAIAIVLTLVLWLGGVMAGFKGPFSLLANGLAIPPISTATVDAIPASLSGGSGPGVLVALVVGLVLRAAIHAAFTGAIVGQLEGGASSGWSFLRGVRAFPVTIGVSLAAFMLLNIGSGLAPLLGGLALPVQLAVLVAGVYLFAFAPVIAVTEHEGTLASLARSVRAARMAGSGNLTFSTVYVLSSVTLLFFPKPGGLLGVNPSIEAWLVVLAISLVHLVFQAAIAYRYLSVLDDVPEAPARRQPARRQPARQGAR